MEEVTSGIIRNGEVNAVWVGRGDYVWLPTSAAGLLLWKDDKIAVFPLDRRCISAALTSGMAEDLDGSVWVRGLSGLYHVNGASCDLIGAEQGYPGRLPAGNLVDHKGTV